MLFSLHTKALFYNLFFVFIFHTQINSFPREIINYSLLDRSITTRMSSMAAMISTHNKKIRKRKIFCVEGYDRYVPSPFINRFKLHVFLYLPRTNLASLSQNALIYF